VQRYSNHPQVPSYHSQLSPVGVSEAAYAFPAISHPNYAHSSYQPVQIPSHDMIADVKYLPQPVLGMSHV
jgi:hypothetical protein